MKYKTFLGNGCNFTPEFRERGDVMQMVSGEDNIQQSLYVLLSTTPGERIHRADYGCPIRQFKFEIITESHKAMMKEIIERAVVLFEPRISLSDVTFETVDNSPLLIRLEYIIRMTNIRSSLVYPFYLEEGAK